MAQVSDSRPGGFQQGIDRLFNEGTVTGLSDSQLLERFAVRNDDAAFGALVERHGPMVLGVCRRFLRDPNDVDDAFQAVFLVLVRKAGDVRRKELLGNWLYGVACRVAIRARSLSVRRPAPITETDGGRLAQADPGAVEDQSWLHEEVERLPRRYRQPVVACYFEGRTHEEAATLLGCPLGTVKGRLSRARDLLRRRLERRGLTVPAVALAARLAAPDLRASVPVALAHATVRAGLALASAGASLMTASAISISARTLTEGVLHAMLATQLKTVAIPVVVVVAGLLTAGATVAARQAALGAPRAEPPIEVEIQPTPKEAEKPASEHATESTPSNPVHLTTFHQLLPAMGRLQELYSRFQSDMQGLATDEARQAALAVHRGRVEAMLQELTDRPNVSDAGRELKAAFARFVRQTMETRPPAEPEGGALSLMGASVDRGRAPGLRELRSIKFIADQYDRQSEALSSDLAALKSPEERNAAQALYRAKLASIRKDVAVENSKEPFRDFAEAFLAYLKKVETQPEPPPTSNPSAPGAPANPPPAAGSSTTAGGGDGAEDDGTEEPSAEQYRLWIARGSAVLARADDSPMNAAVVGALDLPITLRTTAKSTLDDMLKQLRSSVKTSDGKKVPIYVDPQGLEKAGTSLSAPVSIELEDVPLRFSLRLMLKQLGLAYCIRDGVIIISSLEGIHRELMEAQAEQMGLHPDQFPNQDMGGGFGGMGGMGGGQGMR